MNQKLLALYGLKWKPMCSEPCFQCIQLPQLSDEAVVEILDFLQVFTTDFENRYGGQIHRKRSFDGVWNRVLI